MDCAICYQKCRILNHCSCYGTSRSLKVLKMVCVLVVSSHCPVDPQSNGLVSRHTSSCLQMACSHFSHCSEVVTAMNGVSGTPATPGNNVVSPAAAKTLGLCAFVEISVTKGLWGNISSITWEATFSLLISATSAGAGLIGNLHTTLAFHHGKTK